jgi:hypothetical protein
MKSRPYRARETTTSASINGPLLGTWQRLLKADLFFLPMYREPQLHLQPRRRLA